MQVLKSLCAKGHSFVLHERILLKFQILANYSLTFTSKEIKGHWLSNDSLNITESHVSIFRIIKHTTHIHTQRYLYVSGYVWITVCVLKKTHWCT